MDSASFSNKLSKVNNWKQLYQLMCMLEHRKPGEGGRVFELFAKYFFLRSSEYSRGFKAVYAFRELPESIRARLNVGTIDRGIDLVLVDTKNRITAVQCKFRLDETSRLSWTKDKLANFLADAADADDFIFFTNAAGVDDYSARKRNVFVIDSSILSQVDRSDIRRIVSSAPSLRSRSLRPRKFQQQAVDACCEGLKKYDRGQLILPCGAGKTLTSLWIAEALQAKKILVIVPSLALLRQTKSVWNSNIKVWSPYLCVCSELDIDRSPDAMMTDIFEIDRNVTANSEEISAVLKREERVIIYSTYQSLPRVAEASRRSGASFDLAIADEAHRTAGPVKGIFSLVHRSRDIEIRKRLYMTATPRVIAANVRAVLGRKSEFVADMSDPTIFGPELFRMTFGSAIKRGILVDYRILAIGVSDHEIRHAIRSRNYVTETATLEDIAHNLALDKVMKKYGATHALTFHSRVARAEEFAERHQAFFKRQCSALHVNGAQPTSKRQAILDQFSSSRRGVVSNARCLTEGVDIPNIDLVYFCDPRSSKVDIVQATGRALRRSPNTYKQVGYIVVPIFHNQQETVEEVIERGGFKDLVAVVRAMADQDKRLEDEIRYIQTNGLLTSNTPRIRLIRDRPMVLPIVEFDKTRLSNALFDELIREASTGWRPYELAQEFVGKLKLNSVKEWRNYCRGMYLQMPSKPADIPANPDRAYSNDWKGFGDWLGTGRVADQLRVYREFERARQFARSLKFQNGAEWYEYCRKGAKGRPPSPKIFQRIPSKPMRPHIEEWGIGWGQDSSPSVSANIDHTIRLVRSFELWD